MEMILMRHQQMFCVALMETKKIVDGDGHGRIRDEFVKVMKQEKGGELIIFEKKRLLNIN